MQNRDAKNDKKKKKKREKKKNKAHCFTRATPRVSNKCE